MILFNGKIYTPSGFQKAVRFTNGIITNLGTSSELIRLFPDEEKYDLQGKVVLPGFNDAHLHLLDWVLQEQYINLNDVKSITEIVEIGKAALKNNPKHLVFYNFDDEKIKEKRLLTKGDLDFITKDLPIIVYRVCGHLAIINSYLIKNLDLDGQVIKGGFIDQDKGEYTGVLRENALKLINDNFRIETLSEVKKYLYQGIEKANSYGLTSLGSNDLSLDLKRNQLIIQAFKELEKEGRLKARINEQFTTDDLKSITYARENQGSLFKVGALKLFIDGSLGGRTAYLSENYLNSKERGHLLISEDELLSILEGAEKEKLTVLIHAIGDEGVRVALQALSKFPELEKNRSALVHVQISKGFTLDFFADYQVNAIVQPIFITSDYEMAKNRLSPSLLETSYAFKTLSQKTKVSFSSDAPYGSINPIEGIWAAVTRLNSRCTHTFNPWEKMSVEDAIRAYTEVPAYQTFEEEYKGKIDLGYCADLVALDKDIFTIPEMEIKNIEVIMTVFDGKIVYRKE